MMEVEAAAAAAWLSKPRCYVILLSVLEALITLYCTDGNVRKLFDDGLDCAEGDRLGMTLLWMGQFSAHRGS